MLNKPKPSFYKQKIRLFFTILVGFFILHLSTQPSLIQQVWANNGDNQESNTAVQINLFEQATQDETLLPHADVAELDFDSREKALAYIVMEILRLIVIVAFVLALLYLIWGGIDWITSAGDKGKLDSARNKMTQAIIGLVVLSAVLAIFQFMQIIFKVEVFDIDGYEPNFQETNPAGWDGDGRPAGSDKDSTKNNDNQKQKDDNNPSKKPIGQCRCLGNNRCAPTGTIGPIQSGGTCYTCGADGRWSNPKILAGEPNCPTSLKCKPC